jgi:hypothetical protein
MSKKMIDQTPVDKLHIVATKQIKNFGFLIRLGGVGGRC